MICDTAALKVLKKMDSGFVVRGPSVRSFEASPGWGAFGLTRDGDREMDGY